MLLNDKQLQTAGAKNTLHLNVVMVESIDKMTGQKFFSQRRRNSIILDGPASLRKKVRNESE